MNIEIANRLVELRKKSGLSQEDLADKIGVSRQAVSKWETASASPDTDNLICLAKLYGVSLDDLLNTEQPVEDIVRQKKEETKENEQKEQSKNDSSSKPKADKVHIGKDGIHVVDKNGDEVHVSWNGIETTKKQKENFKFEYKSPKSGIIHSISSIFFTTAYILLSIFLPITWGGWGFWWFLFIAIPIPAEIYKMFAKKRLKYFPMALIATIAFFLLGMLCGLWHPGWVVFLAIPLYYTIADAIDKAIKRSDPEYIYDEDDDKVVDNVEE